jgi:glutamine---fructose-6-phosphate transaminase (isomerizing)
MCGIVGYVGNRQAVPIILDGLRRLEYRGYDSAGIAVLDGDDELAIRRASGKLRNLEEVIRATPLEGTFGIGHTRWATHGRPTEENAHPHRDCTGNIVVVHNGIVENYLSLKRQLQEEGHKFITETDTEVIAHLIEKFYNGNLEAAVRCAVKQLNGVFALAIISRQEPGKIVAVRSGPPAVIGLGDGARQDCGGPFGPAGRHRPGRRGVLRRLRCSRDSQPYAGHVLPFRWRHGHSDR